MNAEGCETFAHIIRKDSPVLRAVIPLSCESKTFLDKCSKHDRGEADLPALTDSTCR